MASVLAPQVLQGRYILAQKKRPVKKALAPLAYHGPKILILDIETTPLEVFCWGLWDQTIGLNQIIKDWSVLSWSAKWLHEKKVMYMDTRYEKDIRNDKKIVKEMWDLINEADVIVTQNGKKFDMKKLNSRFLKHGMKPPRDYKQFDTLEVAKKYFAHTSNKLEYMTHNFCTVFEKSTHHEFPGFELWKGCMAKNMKAFKVMEEYNKMDVLSLEELYLKVRAWDNSINLNIYTDDLTDGCNACGSYDLQKNGFRFLSKGKYQRYTCNVCGASSRGSVNLLSKEKRKSLKVK